MGPPSFRPCLCLTIIWLALSIRAGADEPGAAAGWIDLTATPNLDVWKPPTGAWAYVGSVGLDPKNPKLIHTEPGTAILYNGPTGRTNNLFTREKYGDLDVHLEFMIPKGSNSGIKLQGLYEVQILDSHGKTKLAGSDCGGIYPRAELLPSYHYLDQGYPPKTNAARPAGEWQTLDVSFRAPRFDASGKKEANARFLKVALNGETVQDDVELTNPTGHAWVLKEVPTGPLMIQADHGPVALRNLRIRPPARAARDGN